MFCVCSVTVTWDWNKQMENLVVGISVEKTALCCYRIVKLEEKRIRLCKEHIPVEYTTGRKN